MCQEIPTSCTYVTARSAESPNWVHLVAKSLRMPEIVLSGGGEDYVPDRQKKESCLNQHQMAPIDTPTWNVIFSLLFFSRSTFKPCQLRTRNSQPLAFAIFFFLVNWVISSFNRWTIANALCHPYWFSVIPFVWNTSVLLTVECRTTSPMGNRWQAQLNPSPPPFLPPALAFSSQRLSLFCLPLFLILLVWKNKHGFLRSFHQTEPNKHQ